MGSTVRNSIQRTFVIVIVAWALLLTPSCLSRFDSSESRRFYVQTHDAYYRVVSTAMPWGTRLTWDEVNRGLLDIKEHDIQSAPAWSVLAGRQPLALGSGSAVEQSAGWPFAAFQGAVWLSGSDYASLGYVYPHAIGSQGCSVLYEGNDRAVYSKSVLLLVYSPIMRGILLNTCIYAAFAFIMNTLYEAVRKRYCLRVKRCPNCAYDVSGLKKCPECGKWVRGEAAGGAEV